MVQESSAGSSQRVGRRPLLKRKRHAEMAVSIGVGGGQAAGADVALDRRHQQRGNRQLRIAGLAHGNEIRLADAVVDMLVAGALGGDGRFPGILVAARRLVVVAHEQSGFGRQVEQPADRAEQLMRAAAREIGRAVPKSGMNKVSPTKAASPTR